MKRAGLVQGAAGWPARAPLPPLPQLLWYFIHSCSLPYAIYYSMFQKIWRCCFKRRYTTIRGCVFSGVGGFGRLGGGRNGIFGDQMAGWAA